MRIGRRLRTLAKDLKARNGRYKKTACHRSECCMSFSRIMWLSANGGSSQNTYIVRGNAPDLSSHVSTSSDLGLDVAPVSWMESRDHNWGLLMAAVRHRVQILERRRGVCMVLGGSIRSSIQRRKISESSSMGSDPNVP